MTKLNIMCGVPGAGKSHYIKEHYNKEKDVVISRDVIRFSLVTLGQVYFSREKEVFREFCNKINETIGVADTTWADATHLSNRSRWKLLNGINHKNFELINFICVEEPLEICLARNAQRDGRAVVPESAIERMFEQYQRPVREDFLSIENLGEIIVIGGKNE